jgi:hypothetical protein
LLSRKGDSRGVSLLLAYEKQHLFFLRPWAARQPNNYQFCRRKPTIIKTMKKILFQSLVIVAITTCLLNSFGQSSQTSANLLSPASKTAKILPHNKKLPRGIRPYTFQPRAKSIVYSVGARNANSQTWFKVITAQDTNGATRCYTNFAYVEVASGLNYWDATSQQWLASKEEIDGYAGGAIAQFGQHKVIFANNLNAADAIDLQTPDGKELRSHVLGLSYYDSSSGNSVLIAQIKDCQGQIVGSNQVIYTDAFTGVNADVRYTYTRAGLEQDIILQTQPPSPQNYGLNPATTRLQAFTEFLNPPQPTINTFTQPNGTVDEMLDFGAMKMGLGRAFLIGSNDKIPVAKHWAEIDGRNILIESFSFAMMQQGLQTLPQNVSSKPASNSNLYAISRKPLLPSQPLAKRKVGAMLVAKAFLPSKGFVLDYQMLNGNQSPNYTFKGDTTYYISGYVGLSGTTVFEPGAVIKYAPGTYIGGSTIQCQGTSYRPVIFTARDDDSMGQILNESTHTPSGYYAAYVFSITGSTLPTLSNFRILYASCGLSLNYYGSNPTITNAQFVNCQTAFQLEFSGVNVRNALFSGVGTVFSSVVQSQQTTWSAQNVTIDGASYVLFNGNNNNPFTQLTCYNSIFANVAHIYNSGNLAVSGSYNGFFNCPQQIGSIKFTASASPFQSSAGGNYYLTTASGFRGKGTTSVDPALLADLKTKTTYPPVALPAFMEITGNLTFFPQVPRYSGNTPPDLGYNYDILDYTVATMDVAGGNVTVEPGTAIAVQNEYLTDQGGWTVTGFVVEQGSSFISHGTPTTPITFTSTKMVQEQPQTAFAQLGLPYSVAAFVPSYYPDSLNSPAPTLDFRFSNFYLPAQDYHFWGGLREDRTYYTDPSDYWSPDSSVYLSIRDCNLYGGRVNLGLPYNEYDPDSGTYLYRDYVWAPGAISLVNSLFDHVSINFNPTFYWYNSVINCDMQLQAYNNLFHGGSGLYLEPFPASAGNWLFEDNLFDKVHFYQDTGEPLDYDYNGYWPLQTSELNGNGDTAKLSPNTSNDGLAGANDKVLTTAPPYQTGPLGNYYLPTTTSLYNAGSRTAAAAGLAQYTTQTSQTKDSGQVDIGLHYVATSSSTSATPKDSDSDGIPDYVEDANGNGVVDWNPVVNANETDPTLSKTDGSTPDAYSTAYDDIDLSGNGLVGRIEKALGLNPLSPSNPLALNSISEDPNTGIVTCEVPVNYNTLTSIGNLELLVDGVAGEFQECDEAADGNCLLKWNSAFEPPGQHELAAEVILNGELKKGNTPDPTVLNGVGPIFPYNSDNVCQFDPAFSTFDQNGATLYATLPQPDATYTIELQDPNGSHIKWLAVNQTTTSGEINVPWNLTYDDGVTVYTGDSVKAIFNVTLSDPSSGTLAYWLSDASTGPIGHTEYFTVAFAWDNATQASKGGAMWDCIMGSVVNRLMEICNEGWCYDDPYSSSFDTWDTYPYTSGNPGYLQQQPDVQNLLNSLGDGNTMNFYFDGHGQTTEIGNDKSSSDPSDVEIGLVNVENALGNIGNVDGPKWHHPYRLVFLNACHTAEDDHWAHAFGIPDRTTTQELENGHQPQAFLGWDGSPLAAQTDGDWNDTAQTYAVFWDAWMSEQYTLQQCIQIASNPSLSFPFGKKYDINSQFPFFYYTRDNFHLRIYGYAGIKRIGYDPDSSYDTSPYYQ